MKSSHFCIIFKSVVASIITVIVCRCTRFEVKRRDLISSLCYNCLGQGIIVLLWPLKLQSFVSLISKVMNNSWKELFQSAKRIAFLPQRLQLSAFHCNLFASVLYGATTISLLFNGCGISLMVVLISGNFSFFSVV